LCMTGATDSIGLFEGSNDVGNCKLKGSGAYNPSTKVYTLTGAGLNMWEKTDEFHMVWKKETGDFSLSAKIAFEGKGVNAHRKVGVIIRESLEANAKYADVAVHGDGLTSLQYREKAGEITKEVVAPKGADYIQLERRGSRIIMKTATGKFPQDITGEIELELPETCYIGLFICSHDVDVLETGYFSNVEYRKL
ncbi:MAG: hypothetical protein LBV32_00890, partial [Tannerellaceae bacterium]|nr:hypothetical protein [Tannerellaceae bacterium]